MTELKALAEAIAANADLLERQRGVPFSIAEKLTNISERLEELADEIQVNYEAQAEIDGLKAQVELLRDLLEKHGICINCGEIFSHEIEEPFAHCGCGTSEWYKFTPYMDIEHKLYLLRQQVKEKS